VGVVKKPAWEIKIDGKAISDSLSRAVQSIAFNDEAGVDSDSTTIVFAGDLPHIEAGRKIALKIGYQGEDLTSAGLFSVESSSWTKETLTIAATGLNFAGAMKTKRTQTYEGVSIENIVNQISQRAEVSNSPLCNFGDVTISYLAQTDESDMHFLSRLAVEYDAVFSVKSDRIIFLHRASSADAQKLPKYEINAKYTSGLTIKQKARPKYAAVQAIWRDQQAQETQSILVGSGEPIYKLAVAFPDAQTAQKRAEAKLRSLRRDCVEGSFSIDGTMFRAGGIISLKGASENNAEYEIKKVSHRIDKSGWISSVELGGA
jgi:phage protein D